MSTDTGLTNRLRQHSRRSGLAVGLTMALTIAVCIGGFAVIYAQLQPFISDFVSQDPPVENNVAFGRREEPTPEASSDEAPAADDEEESEEPVADDEEPAEEAPPEDPEPTEEPEPTPTPEGFVPDLQILVRPDSSVPVRLRSEASTAGGEATVLDNLVPATPLQTTGEQEPTENPAEDGDVWIEVRTEDGQQGWLREIDTEPYNEDA